MFAIMIVFFFKQETAYELRISDWSSDVCSSDLHHLVIASFLGVAHRGIHTDIGDEAGDDERLNLATAQMDIQIGAVERSPIIFVDDDIACLGAEFGRDFLGIGAVLESRKARIGDRLRMRHLRGIVAAIGRAHTSELQSLMRISYAVFCLKKKIIQPKLSSVVVSYTVIYTRYL